MQVLTGMFSPTSGRIDDRWAAFMRFQIARARQCFADAEAGVDHLDADARWPVWSALILYRCAEWGWKALPSCFSEESSSCHWRALPSPSS
jgi:hypothetical protein